MTRPKRAGCGPITPAAPRKSRLKDTALRAFGAIVLLWLQAMAGFAYVGAKAAETGGGLLPAEFSRVRSLSEIASGNHILIGACDAGSGQLYLLSCAAYTKKSGKKLTAYLHRAGAEEKFTPSASAVLWQISRDAETGEVALLAPDSAKYLSREGDSNTALTLKAADTADGTRWGIGENADGTFVLYAPGSSPQQTGSRRLALDASGTPAVFAHYAGIGYAYELYIYKRSGETGVTTPDAPPADGTTVSLRDANSALLPGGTSCDITALHLSDGTLAPTPSLAVWRTECGEDGTFVLKDTLSGLYLGENLENSAMPQRWTVTDGHVATAGDMPRLLCHDRTSGKWLLCALGSTLPQNTYAATVAAVKPQPTLHTDEAGVTTLEGGWTGEALSSADLSSTLCLDLTRLALPLDAGTLSGLSEDANTPIFVSASQATYTPAGWRFVVLCSAEANTLRDDTRLNDRIPFHTDRPVTFSSAEMSYSRDLGNGLLWQTLCLPFPCKIPDGLYAAEVYADAAATLSATSANAIEAGKAYLIRRRSAESPTEFTFTSTPGTQMPAAPADAHSGDTLQGTMKPLTVSADGGKNYMLRSAENTFRHAAAGSRLAPFRALLRLPADTGAATLSLPALPTQN